MASLKFAAVLLGFVLLQASVNSAPAEAEPDYALPAPRDAADEGLEADADAGVALDKRRSRNKAPKPGPGKEGCDCPPLNADIKCKKGQQKNKFVTDAKCECHHYRCIWEVCPEVKDVVCKKCQRKVEVDDCGCKAFECQDVAPDHCAPHAVHCQLCEKLEQSVDDCGCPLDKCVPLENPPSLCSRCSACETCQELELEPKQCGLKESVCIPKECPHFKEIMCDPDCEEPVFGEDKCGCPFMECKKISAEPKIPECDECHELRKIKIQKCGVEKYECVPAPCKGPEKGKEVCFKVIPGKKNKCGCDTFHRDRCSIVPAGDCPKGSAPQGGSDLCGCPHQICVPCQQMYPERACKKCEKAVKKSVSGGQCLETVCQKIPNCGHVCDILKDMKMEKTCPPCDKLVTKEVGQHGSGCMVKVCVKDLDNQECIPCTNVKEPDCKTCQKKIQVETSNGCPAKVCVHDAENADCMPPPGPPPCPKNAFLRCAHCEKKKKVKAYNDCFIDVCEPSDEPECVCPKVKEQPHPICGKCQSLNPVSAGKCKGVKACTPKLAKDCPKADVPKCSACQEPAKSEDDCGCPKYSCKPKKCAPLDRRAMECPEGETPTIGENVCGCKVKTCIDKEDVCEETEEPQAQAPKANGGKKKKNKKKNKKKGGK